MQDEEIKTFLSKKRIHLFEDEEVFNVLETKKPYVLNKLMLLKVFIVYAFIVLLLIFLGFILNFLAVFALGLIVLAGAAFLDFSIYELKESRSSQFCLITSLGIRRNQKLISWEKVKDIQKSMDDRENKLTFLIPPRVLDSDAILSDKSGRLNWEGDFNKETLYNLILPHWTEHSPETKLKNLSSKLELSYKLSASKTLEATHQLKGMFNALDISVNFNKNIPFQSLKSSIVLPQNIKSHLSIMLKASPSLFKQSTGVDEIKFGKQIQSSHPAVFEQLFTKSVMQRLEQLRNLGTVNWSFGKSLKRKRHQPLSSSIQDAEDVLDTGLLQTNQQPTDYETLEGEHHSTLEFNGILNPNFEEDISKAAEFVELSMELSVLLAEGLKGIKDQ